MDAHTKFLWAGTVDYKYGVVGEPDEKYRYTFADIQRDIKTIITYARPYEICLIYADIGDDAPQSIAAKLLFIMYDRFRQRDYQPATGINIIAPCLLGVYVNRLEAYIVELAHLNELEPEFIDWIEHENHFSNIMV